MRPPSRLESHCAKLGEKSFPALKNLKPEETRESLGLGTAFFTLRNQSCSSPVSFSTSLTLFPEVLLIMDKLSLLAVLYT